MFSKVTLAIQVFCLLVFLRLMLSVVNFSKIVEWMRACHFGFYFSDNLIRNKRMIEILSPFIPKCTCLIKAIAFKMLSSSDTDIKLVIGVSKKDQFESHAWICRNNEIIFGGEASGEKFTKLVDF